MRRFVYNSSRFSFPSFPRYLWLVAALVLVLSPGSSEAQTWSPALNVYPQTNFEQSYPQIAVTPDGTKWVALTCSPL